MAGVARIPRRRGGLCGLLLILLGAWSALAPFIGPYFRFAFTPDKAWAYTSGRLYLSVIPGAVAFLGGLFVLGTRSRAAGHFGGLLAVLAGAWLIAGAQITDIFLKQTSISPGSPVGNPPFGSTAEWQLLERWGFFTAAGALLIFFGALAMGRFSMLSAADAANAEEEDEDYSYPASTGSFPATPASPGTATTGPFPAATNPDQFPSSTGQFPRQNS